MRSNNRHPMTASWEPDAVPWNRVGRLTDGQTRRIRRATFPLLCAAPVLFAIGIGLASRPAGWVLFGMPVQGIGVLALMLFACVLPNGWRALGRLRDLLDGAVETIEGIAVAPTEPDDDWLGLLHRPLDRDTPLTGDVQNFYVAARQLDAPPAIRRAAAADSWPILHTEAAHRSRSSGRPRVHRSRTSGSRRSDDGSGRPTSSAAARNGVATRSVPSCCRGVGWSSTSSHSRLTTGRLTTRPAALASVRSAATGSRASAPAPRVASDPGVTDSPLRWPAERLRPGPSDACAAADCPTLDNAG